MKSIANVMHKLIEKCEVCVNGYVISKELLMSSFSYFLSSTIEKDKHNINIILHTGSICFDAMILAYAAFSDILYDNTDPDEMLHSLSAGDMVLYYRKRYVFKGFIKKVDPKTSISSAVICEDGDYAVLNQDANWTAVHKKLEIYYPLFWKIKTIRWARITKRFWETKCFFETGFRIKR